MINTCPCCGDKPIGFWKKSTTGIFRTIDCNQCNCKLQLNKVIAIPIILLQWLSLPLGAFLSTDIFGWMLHCCNFNSLFIIIPILGMTLSAMLTTTLYYIFVPWKKKRLNIKRGET